MIGLLRLNLQFCYFQLSFSPSSYKVKIRNEMHLINSSTLGTTLKVYFGGVAILLGIFALLVLACYVGHDRSKFRYYAKFIMVYYAVLVGTTILGPVFALRPRDVVNIQ